MKAVLRDIWSTLLGRRRIPRDHDSLWEHSEETGREIGELEAKQRTSDLRATGPALVEEHPAVRVVRGVVEARIAYLSQRVAKRFHRIEAKERQHNLTGERHEQRASDLREQRPSVEPKARAIDPLVSRVLSYLLSFGLVVWVLEASGMWTSLAAYDATLGPIRIPMSLAAGAVLALAGHGAGHLLRSALADHKVRPGLLAGAGIVLAVGILTVISLGIGRDANTKAADRFREVGTLEHEASQLDRRAADLLEPLPGSPAEEPGQEPSAEDRRTAEGLHLEAERTRRQAQRLDAKARDDRTLSFFALIQILGLAVGAVGGFFFAGAAPVREYKQLTRRAGREERKALRHHGHAETWRAKADDIRAKVGRLVIEEHSWGDADLGHHEQVRLVARGFPAPAWAGSRTDLSAHLPDLINRAIKPADMNGADPSHVSDPQTGE